MTDKYIDEVVKRFRGKFNYASFTWNGDNATGVKFAKAEQKRVEKVFRQELLAYRTHLKEELRTETEKRVLSHYSMNVIQSIIEKVMK